MVIHAVCGGLLFLCEAFRTIERFKDKFFLFISGRYCIVLCRVCGVCPFSSSVFPRLLDGVLISLSNICPLVQYILT